MILNKHKHKQHIMHQQQSTPLTFTWSKSTIETLEKGVNRFNVNNKNIWTTPLTPITPFSSVSSVDFGQVIVSCVCAILTLELCFTPALHKKWSSPLRISSVMWPNSQSLADLVAFTIEILNGKLHFLCIDDVKYNSRVKSSSVWVVHGAVCVVYNCVC